MRPRAVPRTTPESWQAVGCGLDELRRKKPQLACRLLGGHAFCMMLILCVIYNLLFFMDFLCGLDLAQHLQHPS